MEFEQIVDMLLSFFKDADSMDENVPCENGNRRYKKIGNITYFVTSNVGSSDKPYVVDKIKRLVQKDSALN